MKERRDNRLGSLVDRRRVGLTDVGLLGCLVGRVLVVSRQTFCRMRIRILFPSLPSGPRGERYFFYVGRKAERRDGVGGWGREGRELIFSGRKCGQALSCPTHTRRKKKSDSRSCAVILYPRTCAYTHKRKCIQGKKTYTNTQRFFKFIF